jgi:hypothetical protein
LKGPLEMIINLDIPDLPSIKEEDFGYDATPKSRRDTYENMILTEKGESKSPTKVEFKSMGGSFLKERDADTELPGSQFKNSARVLHRTRELEKNFTLERTKTKDRPPVLNHTYSTTWTREPTPIVTLPKLSTSGPGDPRAKTDISLSNITIGTPLVDGTRINRVAPEPSHKDKASKFKSAFISGKALGTKQDSMAEADPLDDSIVVTNSQAIRNNSGNVIFNNDYSMNIQIVPSTRETKALGVPKKYNPKDKKKEKG